MSSQGVRKEKVAKESAHAGKIKRGQESSATEDSRGQKKSVGKGNLGEGTTSVGGDSRREQNSSKKCVVSKRSRTKRERRQRAKRAERKKLVSLDWAESQERKMKRLRRGTAESTSSRNPAGRGQELEETDPQLEVRSKSRKEKASTTRIANRWTSARR